MMTIAKRLDKHFAACAAAGAAMLAGGQQADAAVVLSGPVNLLIAPTTNGLYLNVVTGQINEPGNTGGTSVPGWDVNPWSSTTLSYFNPAAPAGGVYIQRLGGGATANIGPAGIVDGNPAGQGYGGFGASAASTAGNNPHILNSTQNFIGFRFQHEGTGQVHYGWMQIRLGATLTDPVRAVIQYAYESTPGAAIQVPGPGAFALVGLAGLAGRGRRRR